MEQHPENPLDPALSFEFLASIYAQLPILIVRLSDDGIILSANPETERVTGYPLTHLSGKNWWGLMFPGKLFAQIPKFTSPAHAHIIARDHPLAMRTASGQVRVVAWTRFQRQDSATGQPEMVCLGLDITDRLLDAEREVAGLEAVDLDALGECPTLPEDCGTFIEPLDASPPVAMTPELWREAVDQAQARLAVAEDRAGAVLSLMDAGDSDTIRLLLRITRGGHYERTLAPLWGRVESMYDRMNAGLSHGITAETRDLGDLVKKRDRP